MRHDRENLFQGHPGMEPLCPIRISDFSVASFFRCGRELCQGGPNSADERKNVTDFRHNCTTPNTGPLPSNWRKRGIASRRMLNERPRRNVPPISWGTLKATILMI